MKKLFTLLIASMLMIPIGLKADNWTETFDDQTSNSYSAASFTCAISGVWTATAAGNFAYANTNMGSYAATINDDNAGANITTPVLNTCGTVSFKYAFINGNETNVFVLQKSNDGINFTDLDTHTLGASANLAYVTYSFDVNDNSSTVYIRVLSDNQNAHLFIEDFTVTDYSASTGPAPLFFSEYIEGGSNNKALEIYNPSAEAVDLASYQIAQSNNGGGWVYYHIFPEGAKIEAGDVWVILNDGTSTALFDFANADEVLGYPSVVHHNGDDARAIIYITDVDTTILDIIGVPDEDPGSGWAVAGVANATANHTLVRKNDTMEGTNDWALSAGTNVDDSYWIVKDQDDFSDLGKYGPDVTAPVVTFDPEGGAVSISTLASIYVRFDEKVFNADGSPIVDANGLVELRLDDAAGALVPFDANIDVNGKYIMITPQSALLNDQVYYVALLAGVVEDEAGNTVETLQSSTFTTIGPIEVTYPVGGEVFYPGQDVHIDWIAEGISNNITLWISFDNGATFEPFIEDIDPSTGTAAYTIPVDSDASLNAVIRITEATNTTFPAGEPMDDSEPFAIVPMLSIATIQGTLEANGNSSYQDTVCLTTGVVSYANGTNEYYISDGEGDYSAVAVRDAVNKPAVGDSVVIAGTVEEYYNLTQMNNLISFEVVASGKPVPAPVSVTTGGAGEALEGVIVSLSSAVVVTETNSYGETGVDDGSGEILIDDVYFAGTLNLGGTYDITGPLSFSYAKWRVYPRSAADVVEIPSSIAGVTSAVYTVDDGLETITDVPALEELAAFKENVMPVYGASYEVYEADGTTVATDLQSGYKLIVTAQDNVATKTYVITKSVLSTDATVSSLVYTIDNEAGTIEGILYKSTVETFEARLDPAAGASFVTTEADGTTPATDLASGYKLVVTAEDGSTTKTYTLTLDSDMPADLIFSEYIEGSGNNKALEVFNPNDDPIKLDYYQIAQLSNGGDDWEYFHIFPSGAVLESHATWVIITDETDGALFAAANADEVLAYPSVVHHNGDDARGLVIVTGMDTTLVDIIGEIGPDPGDGWDVAGITTATKDHTLLRKGTVMEGNTDWASSAGTTADNSEWIVKDQNFFDSLGTHVLVLPEPSSVATLSGIMVDGTGISGFSPAQLTYSVTLDAGTTTVPTVTATPTDENADVVVNPATDLSGDAGARTTTIVVTAEDGTTVKTYSIEFTVQVGFENSLSGRMNIYPVPASDKLFIDYPGDIQSVSVYNITGTAVIMVNNNSKGQFSIDVSSLKGGVYMLKMESTEGTSVARFVKQ